MSKRIYVEHDYDRQYGRFWGHLGDVIRDRNEFLRDPESFDLVCFTGGEDVSPGLYGHQNLGSHNSEDRDKREVAVFELANKYEIPMTGICRGSQFLNVMCGGTMVQHLRANHGGGRHQCYTADGALFEVTSSHHQMNVLSPEGIYLGWSQQAVSLEDCVYDGDLDAQPLVACDERGKPGEIHVTEAFAYPKAHIFAVQHHPEWQDVEVPAAQWTLAMIRHFCFGEAASLAAS